VFHRINFFQLNCPLLIHYISQKKSFALIAIGNFCGTTKQKAGLSKLTIHGDQRNMLARGDLNLMGALT